MDRYAPLSTRLSEPLAPDEANHLAGANLDHAVEPTLAL
jgi:hypothetical protein